MRPPDSWSTARVTLGITLLTAAVWVVLTVLRREQEVALWGSFIPADVGADFAIARAPVWLTPLTAALLHAGPIHLIFNLVMLVFCGRPTEAVLGPISFAILYLLGAYAAAAAQYAVDPVSLTPMVGASGAISAVLGAYALLFGYNKVRVANPTLARWINALWLMAAWVGLNLLMNLVIGMSFAEGMKIAIAAHIGGFALGLLLANPLLLLRYRRA